MNGPQSVKLNPFMKASIGGRGRVWVRVGGAGGVGAGVGVGGRLVEGDVGVLGSEGGVAVVGTVVLDAGVSDVTGDSLAGGVVMGAFGLQPINSASIRVSATITPCFMIASGILIVFYDHQLGNHIML